MAWNPSPEVQVARDAAAALSRVLGRSVNRCAVLFTTTDEKCGYVSFGQTKALCDEARDIAVAAYEAAFDDGGALESTIESDAKVGKQPNQ